LFKINDLPMDQFLLEPVFLVLVGAILVVAGLIFGWSLRAAFPERQLARRLELSEQNRHTLARLYTHLRYQHDLREADFRRTSLEVERLRQIVGKFEGEKDSRQSTVEAERARYQQADARVRQLSGELGALEAQYLKIRARNEEMTHELGRLQEELHAWNALHRDFVGLRQQLGDFQKTAVSLENERNLLRRQLEAARLEIEALQLELLRATTQPRHGTGGANDPTGGPAHRADVPETDDLTVIRTITPQAQQQLNNLGILTFAQIGSWDDDAIIATAKRLGVSPGKIYQEDWMGQARRLMGGYRP
jgi:predicted flap endonuclease-1-like 5' DNA nuclease